MIIEIAAALAAFVAVSAVALSVFLRAPGRLAERRLSELRQPVAPQDEIESRGLFKRVSPSLGVLRPLTSETDWSQRASLELQQAGLRLKVSEYILARLLLAMLLGILLFLITGGSTVGLILALAGVVVGYMVPAWYVTILRGRRGAVINRQLVEALQLISNALRSGFAFNQAVELASKQLTPPIQEELNHFLQESALGAGTDVGLRGLVDRTGSYDVEMMVTSILVQRTTGGNLSEILTNVAETIRERERLHGEIRALTAQQRLAGLVLSVYPIALGALFTLIAPSLMKVLWQEEVGRLLLGIALVLEFLGAWTIGRILRLDV